MFAGQADSFAVGVDFQHFDAHDVAHRDHLGRVVDVSIVELRDVNQTILVDAQVDECPELGHVGDAPFQFQVGAEILDGLNRVGEACDLEFAAGIASRLGKFGEDVVNRGNTGGIIDKCVRIKLLKQAGFPDQSLRLAPDLLRHPVDDVVALGMDGRVIQRLRSRANAQETGRLLKRLGPQLGNFTELVASFETSDRIAIADDVVGQLGSDS